MKIRWAAILLLVFATRYATGQDTGLDEAKLKAQFQGKVVTLHHFYAEKFQRFDADGAAKEEYETCPWTMCSKIDVEKVSLAKNKLKFEGRRIWVLFKGEPRQISYARSPELMEVTIELGDGADREKRLNAAFAKVFLVGKQNFEDDLPDFWKPFFERKVSATPETPHKDAVEKPQPAATPIEKPKLPDRVRVSQGVTEGLLIHKVTPDYPKSALWTHISGKVVMSAVIDREGNIEKLAVMEPVGAGLDEASYEAVKKWKYKPYFLQGNPVQVSTQITVNFELRH